MLERLSWQGQPVLEVVCREGTITGGDVFGWCRQPRGNLGEVQLGTDGTDELIEIERDCGVGISENVQRRNGRTTTTPDRTSPVMIDVEIPLFEKQATR